MKSQVNITETNGKHCIQNVTPILLALLIPLTALFSCAQVKLAAVVPAIPPNYYQCVASVPNDLLAAYYSNYANTNISGQYTGQVFVFNRQVVAQSMLQDKAQDYMNLSTIKCEALYPKSIDSLTVGEEIDIVGVNQGPLPGCQGWLLMSGCIFLPSGTVQLPPPGGATLQPLY